MRYEINDKNEVRIYKEAFTHAVLFQPNWPDGSEFASKLEAEAWAKARLEEMQNPESEFVAGHNAENNPMPRPPKVVRETEPTDTEA